MKLGITRSKKDLIAKIISGIFLGLFIVLFLAVIGFIIYASIPGWKEFGFINIFCTTTYNLELGKASAWLPLTITLLIALLALLIGGPVGIKTATFIKFRVNPRAQRYVRMIVELLADIPSVVFGLFTITILGPVIQVIFHMPTKYNLVSAGFMLGFMIMPTVVSLNLSALDSVEPSFITSPMVLGNTRTSAIYKVYKKQIKSKVIISLVTGVARALGETMAVSMILQGQNYNQVFSQGFGAIWTSYLKTIGGLISTNMFAETLTEGLKGLLFVYGLFLFIVVLFLNGIVKIIFRPKHSNRRNPVTKAIATGLMFIPNQIKKLWNKILNRNVIKVDPSDLNNNLPEYFRQQAGKAEVNSNFYDGWKLFWEIFCFVIIMFFIGTMVMTILVNGINAWQAPSCTVFKFGQDTTGQAFVNTLLVILIAVGVGFIIALATAIFLNEFCKDGKFKSGCLFFIDSLGATPTIVYGMFGMIFFLQMLGMSSSGTSGKSLLAAALTLIFVILPAFTRTILQALQTIPNEVREASYALGVSKWETTMKIVLPKTMQHILTAIVLSIGRVLAETAPIYLTAGLSGGSSISLMSAGQTLTTRIYAQVNAGDVVKARNIMYECALLVLILIMIILILVDIVIPKYYEHKQKKTGGYKIKKEKASFKQEQIDKAKNLFARAKMFYNVINL